MEPKDFIIDANKVLDRFGEWPQFHDMEVVSLLMDRRGDNAPWIEFVVFVWAHTGRITQDASRACHYPPTGASRTWVLSLLTFSWPLGFVLGQHPVTSVITGTEGGKSMRPRPKEFPEGTVRTELPLPSTAVEKIVSSYSRNPPRVNFHAGWSSSSGSQCDVAAS